VVALITPYVAYLLGETLHLSGVTAVIVAGLVIGAWRPQITTAQTRLQLHAVYQTVIFVLESVVFSLIGLELPTLVRDLGNARHWLEGALAVAATLIATRVAWVFPAWAITQRRRGVRRPSWAVPAVVSWAGTRGVVPLAAALSIPLTTTSGAPLPQRDLVLVLAAATIVISLVVQGFTLEPLARFAGFGRDAAADPLPDAESGTLTERELRGDLIAAENSELARLFEDGTISAATRQRLQRSLDLEIARLTEGHR